MTVHIHIGTLFAKPAQTVPSLNIHRSLSAKNKKYDKQDRQGKAAYVRSPHPTQQQAPAARSQGGPQRKIGEGIRQSTGRQTSDGYQFSKISL
jgi:hypothetical protein